MSMLAERKQKQRWYLNPRANKEWVQDSNKFGQRMLEKMGWSTGKGLGANEDGMTEHVKVKYKNDIEGIGYKLRDDQWTQHENNFTQLLANLGNVETVKLECVKQEKSLEKKSQASRARVHYHKFTRGKDLTIRSEKDLANIFGRKTLEKPVVMKEEEEPDNEEIEHKSFGIVTVKSGSMTDYFKSKLSKLGDRLSSAVSRTDDNEESESEICTTAGFGFNSSNKENNKQSFISFISSNAETNETVVKSEPETYRASKDKQSINFVSPFSMKEVLPEIQQNCGTKRKRDEVDNENIFRDKKKKKKKKKCVAFENNGNDINIAEEVCYDNPCLSEADNVEQNKEIGLDNPAFNTNDENDRKKRKSVTFASPLAEYSVISDDSPKKKKKKKKKKQNIGIDNPACEEIIFEIASTEIAEETESRKKQKPTIDSFYEECTPTKKIKKNKNLVIGFENLACTEILPNEKNEVSMANSLSKKRKKKRKSIEIGITNLACEESAVNCADNMGCSINLVEEGIENITNAIDNYQTELENEINERKIKKIKKKRKINKI